MVLYLMDRLVGFFAKLGLLVSGFFVVLSWVVPNHYAPWSTAYNDFSIFIACAFFGSYIFLRGVSVGVGASSVFFLLCALIPLFQFVFGVIFFVGDALLAAFYLLAFSAVLVLGRGFSVSPLKRQAHSLLACCIIIAAVLSVWLALMQWLMLPGSLWVADLNPGGRPFANLAQPNNLATLLCLGLASLLYLYETRRVGVWVGGALALFLLFAIALTQSRTPWVGAVGALLWWAWKGRELSLRLSLRAFVGWLVLYALLVLGLPYFAEALYLSPVELAEHALAAHRWELWQQLGLALVQGPLWGYGWNQVSVAQVAVALDLPLTLMTEHSHNIVLDLLLWNGPLLGGLIIALLAAWLVRLGLLARSCESVFALLAVGFVLVHGLLEYPLEYAFFLLPVGFLLGMVEGEQQARTLFTLPRWMFAGCLLASLVVIVWVWREYRVIEEDYRQMRFETARIGTLKSEHAAPDVVLLSQLREFIRFARTEATPNMSEEQLEWMRKVAHRYPYPPSMFRYALVLGLNNQTALAEQELLRLRALHGEEHYQQAHQAMLEVQGRYSLRRPDTSLPEVEIIPMFQSSGGSR